jgi:hypothetical protein
LAFKAEFFAFEVGAVADFTKLVFSGNTTRRAVWAGAFLHFGAFFASYSTYANKHFEDFL